MVGRGAARAWSVAVVPAGRRGGARIVWAEVATYVIVAAVAISLLVYFLVR